MTSELHTTSQFELQPFLEQRTANPSFTLVEIGHGNCPVVDLQPHPFTGEQCYIGLEANMRGQGVHYSSKRAEGPFTHKNAFFLQHYLGMGKVTERNVLSNNQSYEGEYHAETVLSIGIADEVVASNVFCDPLIAKSRERTVGLLKEVARLLAPTGTAVLRETITPAMVVHIDAESLGEAGLRIVSTETPSEAENWRSLESLYGIWRSPNPTKGYYLFLGKVASAA